MDAATSMFDRDHPTQWIPPCVGMTGGSRDSRQRRKDDAGQGFSNPRNAASNIAVSALIRNRFTRLV